MNLDHASGIVIDLAKHLVSLAQKVAPNWTEAFWRFECEEARYGSNGSYATPEGVELFGALKHGEVLDAMQELGRKLWLSQPDPAKRFRVCLLVASANLDYKIYFEPRDISRWRITKLDGASGRPAGFDARQSAEPDRPKGRDADESVKRFIAGAREGLALQTSSHDSTWHMGSAPRWDVDLDRGELTFSFADGVTAVMPIQVIGTYNLNDGTFLWGWDHPSIPEPLRAHARLALEWGRANDLPAFTNRKVACSEDEAWSFTAVANRLAGANGAYRGPTGSALVFMTLGEITLSKK